MPSKKVGKMKGMSNYSFNELTVAGDTRLA